MSEGGDSERLVVLLEARLTQFEKEMARAEKTGARTYQGLQAGAFKATTAIEKQMLASAKAQGRALESVFGQQVERAGKSARDSAAAFREFDKARASVDNLRASIDPLFAASKRYEAAVEELNNALRLGVVNEQEHAAALDRVAAEYLQAGTAAETHSGALGRLGNISSATRAKIQNTGYQVQDFAVQVAGGTSATRALSQQLPQLLSGFGLVGIAVGTLAAVGMPLLGAAFGGAGKDARDFDAIMGDVRNSVSAVNEAAKIYTAEGLVSLKAKYGEVNAELLEFIDLQSKAAQIVAMNDVREAMKALQDTFGGGWLTTAQDEMRELFDTTNDDAARLLEKLEQMQHAKTFEEQLRIATEFRERIVSITGGLENMTAEQFEFYQKIADSEDALRQLAAAVPKANWLAGMIEQAQTLSGALWEALEARLGLNDGGEAASGFSAPASRQQIIAGYSIYGRTRRMAPKVAPGTGEGGGGGGGGANPLEALLAELQTEREAIAAWYAESLEALNAANEAQLAAVGGKHAALERLEAEHQERLRAIKEESNTGALANAESFFGAMATLTAAGGARMEKAARAFAAAEALINVYRAQAQVLADPKLSFWQKLPAMAAIGAAGMKLVSALGGGSKSAGGSSTGAASSSNGTQEGAERPLAVTIQGLDPKAIYSGQAIIDLANALQKEFGTRGLRLGFL